MRHTGTGLWIGTKVAFHPLHFYCVCCELLSASNADALLFVNVIVSGIFHGRFAQRLAVNKPCLQIVRHLLWKQTTTHSIRNNNAMFEQQPLSHFKGPSQYNHLELHGDLRYLDKYFIPSSFKDGAGTFYIIGMSAKHVTISKLGIGIVARERLRLVWSNCPLSFVLCM